MPANTSMYFQQPAPQESAGEAFQQAFAQGQQINAIRAERAALAEQRRANTEKIQQETAAARKTAFETEGLTALFGSGQPVKDTDVYRFVGPERGAKIIDAIQATQKGKVEGAEALRQHIGAMIGGVEALPEPMRGAGYTRVRDSAIQQGWATPDQIPEQYDPAYVAGIRKSLLSPKEQMDADTAAKKPIVAPPPGQSLLDPVTHQPIYTSPEKVQKPASAQEFEYAQSHGYKGSYEQYQTEDANRKRPVTNITNAAGAGDGLDEAGQELLATQYRIAGTSAIPTRISGSDRAKIINQAAAQMKVLGQSPAVAIQRQYALKADAGSLNKISTMAATASAFENKAIQQADLVRELSARVNRTNFPILNKALLAGKRDLAGDADTQLLYNALTTFTAEYAKIIEGSTGSAAGSTDAARKASATLAHAALNKDTLAKTLDLMQKEMRYTIQGYDATKDAITAKMGGAPQSAQSPAAAPAGETPEARIKRLLGGG